MIFDSFIRFKMCFLQPKWIFCFVFFASLFLQSCYCDQVKNFLRGPKGVILAKKREVFTSFGVITGLEGVIPEKNGMSLQVKKFEGVLRRPFLQKMRGLYKC
jgi:hypothetical protein